MKIVVYSKSDCPFCTKAKAWLDERGIPFDLVVIDNVQERQNMYDRLVCVGSKRTVPQIVVDGVRLGGYAELLASDLEERFMLEGMDLG